MDQRYSKLRVVGYQDVGPRSQTVVQACLAGARMLNMGPILKSQHNFRGVIEGDIAVLYGLRENLKSIYTTYVANGKHCLFVDLGYFGRTEGGKLSGYHRVSVNELFPNKIFENNEYENFNVERYNMFNFKVRPMRTTGKYILLAGMSAKSAIVNGFAPEQFEREAIAKLKTITNMPVVYRPKPSWAEARPIPGALYSPPQQDLNDVLADAYAVVTHHSNTAIDGLIQGVPAIVAHPCPPQHLSGKSVSDITTLPIPSVDEVRRFLLKLTHCQWSVEEMVSGLMWKFLFKSGAIKL